MSKARVLIVDDDADLLVGLDAILKAHDYDVVCATDAPVAIAVARREKPDVVVLDLGLPGGDGYTVMSRLNVPGDSVTIPVIVLSAREPSSDQQKSIKAGAIAYFQKPTDISDLLSTIREAVTRPEQVSD